MSLLREWSHHRCTRAASCRLVSNEHVTAGAMHQVAMARPARQPTPVADVQLAAARAGAMEVVARVPMVVAFSTEVEVAA